MNQQFKIFVDRLRDGQTLMIDEKSAPDFLQINEEELRFTSPVSAQGKAYLTSDHLILCLAISTDASMPCLVCNEFFSLPIQILEFTHAEPLSEIVNHIFDFTDLLRETILLEIPSFAECHQGVCPERISVTTYFKQHTKAPDPVHYPFNNL